MYQPDTEVIAKLNDTLTDEVITLVTGEWCPDCRAASPALEAIFPLLSVKVVTYEVERGKFPQKVLDLGVRAIPTLLILRNGREIGRIIEKPASTWERDMVQIAERS